MVRGRFTGWGGRGAAIPGTKVGGTMGMAACMAGGRLEGQGDGDHAAQLQVDFWQASAAKPSHSKVPAFPFCTPKSTHTCLLWCAVVHADPIWHGGWHTGIGRSCRFDARHGKCSAKGD